MIKPWQIVSRKSGRLRDSHRGNWNERTFPGESPTVQDNRCSAHACMDIRLMMTLIFWPFKWHPFPIPSRFHASLEHRRVGIREMHFPIALKLSLSDRAALSCPKSSPFPTYGSFSGGKSRLGMRIIGFTVRRVSVRVGVPVACRICIDTPSITH